MKAQAFRICINSYRILTEIVVSVSWHVVLVSPEPSHLPNALAANTVNLATVMVHSHSNTHTHCAGMGLDGEAALVTQCANASIEIHLATSAAHASAA